MTSIRTTTERARFERGMSLAFAASFVTVGIFHPFFPVWMSHKGLDDSQIGAILALQIGLRVVVSPLVLGYADRAEERASVLVAFAWAAAAAVLLFFVVDGFAAILIAALVLAAMWGPIIPLTDAVALAGVRRQLADYGRTRLWGSVAFIAANIVGGLVMSELGVDWFVWLLIVTFVLAAALTMPTPRIGRSAQVARADPPSRRAFTALVLPDPDIRRLLPALTAAGLVQASHALFYGFGSILWTERSYTAAEIGTLWAIGVVAEIVLFTYATRLLSILGARWFLVLGGLVGTLRWALFPIDLGFLGYAALQVTHAFSFGATHLALQAVIQVAVADHRIGAAQGAAYALQTVLMAVATIASGAAYGLYGPQAFYIMAAMTVSAVLLSLGAPRAFTAASAP